MNSPSRQQSNRPDGAASVAGSGGDPAPVRAQNPGFSGEPSSGHHSSVEGEGGGGGGGEEQETAVRCRTNAANDTLVVYQSRSIFHFTRRQSSGYFSLDSDSVPSSPRPVTADKATQTPSPSAQVINHALLSVAETQRTNDRHSSSSTRRGRAARDMQAERAGQELQRIGDDYDRFIRNRAAVRRRQAVIGENPPRPGVLLFVGLLLLVIGRIIYLHGVMSSHDLSQV